MNASYPGLGLAQAGALSTSTQGQNSVAGGQTLGNAMEQLEVLNKRLGDICARCSQFASLLAGPTPVPNLAVDKTGPESAMARLNGEVNGAHRITGQIEELLGMIGRSLGA